MNHPRLIRYLLVGVALALAALRPATLSRPAQAAAPLTLSPFEIATTGTKATIGFTSSDYAIVTVDHKPATGAGPPVRLTGSAVGAVGPGIAGPIRPVARHQLNLTGLKSNTAYAFTVTATAADGRTATGQGNFTTFQKTLRIVLESIDIEDDGDGFLSGKGEPSWRLNLDWPGRSGKPNWYCYPSCYSMDGYGEGRFTPRNPDGSALMLVLDERNLDVFPTTLALSVAAHEDDPAADPLVRGVECTFSICLSGEQAPTVWRVPQGVESASATLTVDGNDTRTGFESVLTFRIELGHTQVAYSVPNRNTPYSTWPDDCNSCGF